MVALTISAVGSLLLVVVLQWRWKLLTEHFHPWLKGHADLLGAYRSLLWLFTLPVILIGGYLAFLEIQSSHSLPDARLVFARPEEPVFWVWNQSDRVVREPKYGFLLYNLDVPGQDGEQCLNLKVPFKILDFIRPGGALGPFGIRQLSTARSQAEDDHHIFGYAQIECPDCATTRYYWLFVRVGEGGWYAEIEEEQQKGILKNIREIVYDSSRSSRFSKVNALVPPKSRIGMSDTV